MVHVCSHLCVSLFTPLISNHGGNYTQTEQFVPMNEEVAHKDVI